MHIIFRVAHWRFHNANCPFVCSFCFQRAFKAEIRQSEECWRRKTTIFISLIILKYFYINLQRRLIFESTNFCSKIYFCSFFLFTFFFFSLSLHFCGAMYGSICMKLILNSRNFLTKFFFPES